MLYFLLKYLSSLYSFPGSGLYKYISLRAGCAAILSLTLSVLLARKLIKVLSAKNFNEEQRDLGFFHHKRKSGVPSMGGLAIIAAIVLPTILFARVDNVYILLLVVSTLLLGTIGFADDYLKICRKNKDGLVGWVKIIGQVILGVIVSCTLYFHKDIVVREHGKVVIEDNIESSFDISSEDDTVGRVKGTIKTTKTNIPFLKNNELDYAKLIPCLHGKWAILVYMLAIIFIICAVSNAANLTDGLDGLAAGTASIIGSCLIGFVYLSGNVIFSKYLKIFYIPDIGEVVIFATAFVGACIGFLWYNAYPAQIFMGDTGSLTLGGIIAIVAIIVRKELLLPILCGVFVIENLSVVLQVAYFKYTRRRYGAGRRIFLCAPLHHHFQKKGMHEAKIVARFLIVSLLFALLCFMTLKLR